MSITNGLPGPQSGPGFLTFDHGKQCSTLFAGAKPPGDPNAGRRLKFVPLIWGAVTCWVLAIVTTFVNFQTNMLLIAAAVLLGYIIPGHLLRREYKMNLQKKTI